VASAAGRVRRRSTRALPGGFSTKIHLKTDLDGYPIGFHLTGGEASDSRNFEVLLDLGPDVDPRAVVADKGYDAAFYSRPGEESQASSPQVRRQRCSSGRK
jgi:hypothetical protein